MALHLCRPKHRFPNNPSLVHLFSTSHNQNDDDDDNNNKPKSSLHSYFSDVKARLRKQSTTQTTPLSPIEEIRQNLAEFRQLSAAPPPTDPTNAAPSSQSQEERISFQELYNRNQSLNQSNTSRPGRFDSIRESLRRMRPNTDNINNSYANNVHNRSTGINADSFSTRLGGIGSSRVIGGTEELPFSIFGREMEEESNDGGAERDREKSMELTRMYSYAELGEKLRQLRPQRKKDGEGFSLQELNQRLFRLREMEKQDESRLGGVPIKELRKGLRWMNLVKDDGRKKSSSARLGSLGLLGGTPKFMLYPPKEHLVEKYFHPDNMSSAEKMKIELAKVRDEFKMSEADCGSARVQVAQLTTKIKHLSSVLHKKDKHSRKGLQGMVQRRKRLLKYLRRTDWDSYCFVLSKLGLRDNPDYKA